WIASMVAVVLTGCCLSDITKYPLINAKTAAAAYGIHLRSRFIFGRLFNFAHTRFCTPASSFPVILGNSLAYFVYHDSTTARSSGVAVPLRYLCNSVIPLSKLGSFSSSIYYK